MKQPTQDELRDFFLRVAERLRAGWCQNVSARDARGHETRPWSDEAAQWCLGSAVREELDSMLLNEFWQDGEQRMWDRLHGALVKRGATDAAEWNDRRERTKVEVIDLVLEAAYPGKRGGAGVPKRPRNGEDGDDRVKVDVTREDIENGERRSPSSCPISLAIGRRRNVDHVKTEWDGMSVTRGKRQTWYRVPRKARSFIEDFDDGKTVDPARFEFRSFSVWEYDPWPTPVSN